ncbi:hypothetical protein EB72_24785 [Mycobacterium sp. SWH-M1]|nr:hypothetical protein EB72_24785 [Mycobacterium sp. SWH-M1]
MAESVTVTPGGHYDGKGKWIQGGSPVSVTTLGIAPGNTTLAVGQGGDSDTVEFTVYLELGSPISDDDLITVRGKQCKVRVQEWRSPQTNRGGLVVLASLTTGKGA